MTYQEPLLLEGAQMSFQVKKTIQNSSFLQFAVHQEVMAKKTISFVSDLLELPFFSDGLFLGSEVSP